MSHPIAIVTADLHLAKCAWAKRPGLEGDSYFSFGQIIDNCTNQALALILAGDVFDKVRPDPVTINNMSRRLNRMERNDLSIFYTQGQHELDRFLPWLSSLSTWPTHVNKETFVIADRTFYGLDWTPVDRIQDELSKVPLGTDVLVAHQVWQDFMGTGLGVAECKFDDVCNVEMMITGDYHKHLIYDHKYTNSDQHMTVLSPGSICMQSIDEDPNKYYFILNDDLTVISVKLKTRPCYRCKLDNKADLDLFIAVTLAELLVPKSDLPEFLHKPIIDVSYVDDIPNVHKLLTEAVGSQAHLFTTVLRMRKDAPQLDFDLRKILKDQGLESCLAQLTPAGSGTYLDTLALLRSVDPREQLDESYKKFLEENANHD